MAESIRKVWELTLDCGHQVIVHPGPEGAFVVGAVAGCPTCDGILGPATFDGPGSPQWAEECQEFGCHGSDGEAI